MIKYLRNMQEFFIEKYACDDRFMCMAQTLGMQDAQKAGGFYHYAGKTPGRLCENF